MLNGAWRMLRFCCVGVLNTGITSILYFISYQYISIYLAYAFSWIVACVCSYVMNKFWTFRATDTGVTPFIRFVVVNICSLGLGLILMRLFVSLGAGRIWSYVFSVTVTMMVSYLGYRFWSFKHVDGTIKEIVHE